MDTVIPLPYLLHPKPHLQMRSLGVVEGGAEELSVLEGERPLASDQLRLHVERGAQGEIGTRDLEKIIYPPISPDIFRMLLLGSFR